MYIVPKGRTCTKNFNYQPVPDYVAAVFGLTVPFSAAAPHQSLTVRWQYLLQFLIEEVKL
jgi:hypothetical protein